VFAVECFIDELAQAAKKDPVAFRRALLAKSPRMRKLLDTVAARIGWGKPLPKGRYRGVACAPLAFFGTYVAQCAEVSVESDKTVRVHRVVCAVDCGEVVNPDTIEAQMESSIAYGLTAALKGEITIDKGRVVQENFDDYPLLTMDEMPKVEVYIVRSKEKIGGIGEPGTPPIAPAVANAVSAAIGKRVRQLPIRL
jgi:isoquinoline 1-oxidoreductase beta subunit